MLPGRGARLIGRPVPKMQSPRYQRPQAVVRLGLVWALASNACLPSPSSTERSDSAFAAADATVKDHGRAEASAAGDVAEASDGPTSTADDGAAAWQDAISVGDGGLCESAQDCPIGLVCLQHRCQSCTADDQCADRFACALETGRCLSSCTNDGDCADDAFCQGSQCLVRLDIGSTCQRDAMCQSGTCLVGACCPAECPFGCDAERCLLGIGQTCDSHEQCLSGDCSADVCLGASGESCLDARACVSTFCTDHLCCAERCDAPCRICSTGGVCLPVERGADPECPTSCVAGVCLPCPTDMVPIDGFCIDAFEAPNRLGALPLVMFTMVQAEAWCQARGRRLCFDDEWTRACEGDETLAYPYGDTHQPGVCNDEETWLTYNGPLLEQWPNSASTTAVESYQEQLMIAWAVSAEASASATHLDWLYQAEPAGSNTGCVSSSGVLDLCGNVEEWVRRRDGGADSFHGRLKGRFWAEARTCQSAVSNHGDYFRFYEVGFRCCADQL